MVAAIIGQNFTMSATFLNEDGTPFVVSKPVEYNVYAFDNSFIIGGAAIQSKAQPQEWFAYFAIPSNAPVPNDANNQKYRIEWLAENTSDANNQQMKAIEYFEVLDRAEPLSYDSAIAILPGQPIKDFLCTELPIQSLSLSVSDYSDKIVYTQNIDNPKSELKNNAYVTYIDTIKAIPQVTDKGMGLCPYLLVYSYTTDQGIFNEVHTLYIATAKVLLLVNDLRRYMDKARNEDIDPSLRWTDVELIHFITQGLAMFNNSAPSITNYTFTSLPPTFMYCIKQCAALEALNALYLAEGFRAGMEFTGASVTLNIDRTQYIQYKIDEIKGWIDANLEKEKKLLIRQSNGMGVTGVQFTSVMNGFNRFYTNAAMARLIRRW